MTEPSDMPVRPADLLAIETIVKPLTGQTAWGAARGHGSFLTIEFGQRLDDATGTPHGEWHLWLYCCAWRLERAGHVVGASEDDRELLAAAVAILDGRTLHTFHVAAPALDAELGFDDDVVLRTFAITSREYEHWKLFLPDRRVLVVGPGTTWTIGR